MKNCFFKTATIIIATIIVASCSSNGDKPVTAETSEAENHKIDTLIAIQDSPQQMPSYLFAGQYDELLNEILPEGTVESSINAFLLERGDKMVLFDAGLGESQNGHLREKLDSIGISTDDITDICITHFHGDHIGGLLTANGEAVFKNAKLHFSDLELETWTVGVFKDRDETVKNMLTAYANRYETFHAGDTIIDGIVTIAAPGHTPGHTLFDIGDAIIVGDLLHAVDLQIEHPEFSALYDFNPLEARETRISMLEKIRDTHKPMAGMHFTAPFIIKL
ncbi:MAG: MBL fold metallo-hydrolase [Bacteroidales bacterium]|nr:MBL fold metallo-hydrolase [Bacteroidales bacterium]